MAKYDKWTSEEGLLLIEGWSRDGLTTEQIAHNMGVSRSTLNTWIKRFPDIADTLKKGKDHADREVEASLFNMATGYTVTVSKPIKVKKTRYKNGKKAEEYEEVIYGEEEVYIPPNTTAQIFWLKNRKPDVWRDKVMADTSIKVEDDGFLDALSGIATNVFGTDDGVETG